MVTARAGGRWRRLIVAAAITALATTSFYGGLRVGTTLFSAATPLSGPAANGPHWWKGRTTQPAGSRALQGTLTRDVRREPWLVTAPALAWAAGGEQLPPVGGSATARERTGFCSRNVLLEEEVTPTGVRAGDGNASPHSSVGMAASLRRKLCALEAEDSVSPAAPPTVLFVDTSRVDGKVRQLGFRQAEKAHQLTCINHGIFI